MQLANCFQSTPVHGISTMQAIRSGDKRSLRTGGTVRPVNSSQRNCSHYSCQARICSYITPVENRTHLLVEYETWSRGVRVWEGVVGERLSILSLPSPSFAEKENKDCLSTDGTYRPLSTALSAPYYLPHPPTPTRQPPIQLPLFPSLPLLASSRAIDAPGGWSPAGCRASALRQQHRCSSSSSSARGGKRTSANSGAVQSQRQLLH